MPMMSQANKILCPIMIVAPMESGIPNPMINPKLNAKLVAAASLLSFSPLGIRA